MAVLPDSLSDGKQTLLSKLTAACPEMTSLAALVCSFAGLLTPAPANEAALKDWAEAARACDLMLLCLSRSLLVSVFGFEAR